jgi:hypothetical protein
LKANEISFKVYTHDSTESDFSKGIPISYHAADPSPFGRDSISGCSPRFLCQSAVQLVGVFLFLLTPDIPMLLFLVNPRLGSIVYNLVHTLIFPLTLAIFSGSNGNNLGLQIALIWLAHIGMDRAVGYGFKYPGYFKQTHFSRI